MARRLQKLASTGVVSALALAACALGVSAAPAAPAGADGDDRREVVEVQVRGAHVRVGPGMDSPVVTVVYGGHRLPVLERGDTWVRIGLDDGQDGWIHGSLVAPAGTPPARAEAAADDNDNDNDNDNDRLRRFKAVVEGINERVRRATGAGVFARIDADEGPGGGGAVELTAAAAWLAAPEAARRTNLDTLFRLWDELPGPDAPLVVRIVDERGEVLLEGRRDAGPAALPAGGGRSLPADEPTHAPSGGRPARAGAPTGAAPAADAGAV